MVEFSEPAVVDSLSAAMVCSSSAAAVFQTNNTLQSHQGRPTHPHIHGGSSMAAGLTGSGIPPPLHHEPLTNQHQVCVLNLYFREGKLLVGRYFSVFTPLKVKVAKINV